LALVMRSCSAPKSGGVADTAGVDAGVDTAAD
jgi:hypothetical protein